MVSPLLAVRRLAPTTPDLTDVKALAFTSRNGVEVFAALHPDRSRPVFVVGDATAEAARAAGFGAIRSAAGDLADLARLLEVEGPSDGVILAPGAREPAGDLSGLVAAPRTIRALAVYEAVETGAPPPQAFDAVLVHSPRAGRALAAGLGRDGARDRLAVAISAAAAAPLLSSGFSAVRVAVRPSEADILEALGNPARAV